MAPELLESLRFGLQNAVPTQEGDIYALGLVVLQVIVLSCRHILVLTDILSGPDRTATI